MSDERKNYLAEIALAFSVTAFTGAGLFLIEWGEARAQIVQAAEDVDELDQWRQGHTRDYQKLIQQSARQTAILEGLAARLDVPVPRRPHSPPTTLP